MFQHFQNCSSTVASGLQINAAQKVLNSDISGPNSVCNGMFIGNSMLQDPDLFETFPQSVTTER